MAAIDSILSEARRGGARDVTYVVPSDEEARRYGSWAASTLRGGADAGPPLAGFVRQAVPGRSDLVAITEVPTQRRGAGAIIARVGPARPLLIEAPHTFFDTGTLPIAVDAFEALQARALLVNTVHRYNLGRGGPPGDDDTGGSPSDVAHAPVSMFLAAHTAMLEIEPTLTTIQMHGFGDKTLTGVDMVLSPSRTDLPVAPIAERMRTALAPFVIKAYPAEVSKLGALTNIEAAACQAKSARFLHIEMSKALRDRLGNTPELAAKFAEALRQVAPGGP